MGFEPTYSAYSDAGKPFGKQGYPEWLKNNYEAEIEAANKRIAFLESQRNASIETEKANARKALYALAGAHFCTPIEGYGSNASWAISDICRAVKELADTKRYLGDQLAEEKRGKCDWMGVAAQQSSELAEAHTKCAELTQRLSQAQSRAGAALGMINTYGLKI